MSGNFNIIDTITQSSTDGFARLDVDMIVRSCNREFKKLISSGNIIGNNLSKYCDTETYTKLITKTSNFSDTKTIQQFTVRTASGKLINIQSQLTPLFDNSFVVGYSIMLINSTKNDRIIALENKLRDVNSVVEQAIDYNSQMEIKQLEILTANHLLKEERKKTALANEQLKIKQGEVIVQNKSLQQHREEILAINEMLEQKQISITEMNENLTIQKAEILERYNEVELQKLEFEAQSDLAHARLLAIQKHTQKITSSISYAQRIQKALLSHHNDFSKIFREHFILFRPKEVVSGDFYWFKKIKEYTLLVAADSTGHGVPGAFMSMLGISLLNGVSEQMFENDTPQPSDILNKVRSRLIDSLHQNEEESRAKDGIDLAFCMIHEPTLMLSFSGAFNPLFIIRDNEIIIIKANRFPIGKHGNVTQPFTTETFQLQANDCLYMFSDGYVDQFDATGTHKYLKKHFKGLLIRIHNESMNFQKQILKAELDTWRGKASQTDDILVLGFRI